MDKSEFEEFTSVGRERLDGREDKSLFFASDRLLSRREVRPEKQKIGHNNNNKNSVKRAPRYCIHERSLPRNDVVRETGNDEGVYRLQHGEEPYSLPSAHTLSHSTPPPILDGPDSRDDIQFRRSRIRSR